MDVFKYTTQWTEQKHAVILKRHKARQEIDGNGNWTGHLGGLSVGNRAVEFIWLRFMGYSANTFTQIIPAKKFQDMLQDDQLLSAPLAVLYWTAQGRSVKDVFGPFYLKPDLDTAYIETGSGGTRAILATDFVDKVQDPLPLCPRSNLRRLCHVISDIAGFSALVGFEVEVIFMRPVTGDSTDREYEMINKDHSWGSMSADDREYLKMIECIVRELSAVGLFVDNVHAECAPGQWEFVLPPADPVQAVDDLVKARHSITCVAESFGLRATLSPRPHTGKSPTGSHVHMSLNPVTQATQPLSDAFFAGVIAHLPSIMAFCMPQVASYERVAAGCRACGVYATWGWYNKETPLRRMRDNRFEIRVMDGLANPYLALGVANGKDPAKLSADEREATGAHRILPASLEESLVALECDQELIDLLGEQLVRVYLMVKRREADDFKAMDPLEQKRWLISKF
ncbi:glutamine synthetase bacteria [Aspergillus arachidicola]|uniref:Glutamine synthetase bacteria n=1 Tax=Aspergillus arachidicola TaxID=656916 RepID=A0A2G7G1G1_9EURO|nr:glutamine synthetase bacteria [Aspergillus arachidicola]